MAHYARHVFFCVNERTNGKKCCQDADARDLCDYAKQQLIVKGLHGKAGIRINKAGCLGRCTEGPAIVIYPDGVWYTYKNKEDIDEIIERHLIKGEVVSRLLMEQKSYE